MRPGLRAVAAVLVVSFGYMAGAATAVAAIQQTSEEPSYQLTCSQPAPKEQAAEGDQLRTSNDSGVRARNPETQVDYQTYSEHLEVRLDAVSKPEGASMRPSIYSGNTVLLEEYGGSDIESGQIIRYESNGGHTIHRVTASYDDTSGYVVTKGDNNQESERVRVSEITHVALGVLYT